MLRCMYDQRSGQGCKEERTMDFEFCIEHLQTPRGRQHALDVISKGDLTLPSEVQRAIDAAREIPDEDYQTSALEKMSEALDRILEWEEDAKGRLHAIDERNWRYEDRKGAEQLRSEVGIYERALDRTSKHVGSMSKAAFQEKMITLGKAQVEMMIRMLMSVVTELKLPNDKTDYARQVLLEKFRNEANLTPRIESVANKQLLDYDPSSDTFASNYREVNTGGVKSVSIQGERVY